MNCQLCGKPAAKSSIINGKYYRALCRLHYQELLQYESPSSGHADYNRGRDVEEHEADMIQPYDGDGSISKEFIQLYPETAHKMFSDEEITQAERS